MFDGAVTMFGGTGLNQALLLLGAIVFLGCSRAPAPLAAPVLAADAAQAAIAKYDTNHDGAISGDELAKVPAFKAALKRDDTSGDGKISADEIEARFAAWQKTRISLTNVIAIVRQNGQPLVDAQVTIVPEEFLGPNVKPAKGTTDSRGMTALCISKDPDESGVHLGFYRVQISKKLADGKEAIPARYNSATELGIEVTPDDPGAERLVVNIKSP